MIRPRAAISWSGGKDSLAAVAATRERLDLVCALTMFDESGGRSRSHGLRPELVAAQAQRLGLRSVTARCSWSTYNDVFTGAFGLWRRTASRTWSSAISCIPSIGSGRKRGAPRPG